MAKFPDDKGFSSDHLRCLSIRNDQDNPQSDLTWVPALFFSGATFAAKSFIDRSRAGEESYSSEVGHYKGIT